jgi:glycosyltransferase involved in cell wall biosynthesis
VTSRRVAFFLPSLRGGGAERVALNLAQSFTAHGVAADLVAVSGTGEFEGQIPAGVRLIDLHASRVLRGLPRLVGYLRRERPSAIISFMDHAGVVALLARRLSGISTRVICTVHNTLSHAAPNSSSFRSRAMPVFLRLFYPQADAVVAVSHGVATSFSEVTGFPLEKIRVIYNPVITTDLATAGAGAPGHTWLTDGGPPVVLAVGRLTRQKDFGSLVRAFAKVLQKHPARLLILGEGEERSSLEALVRELGLASSVALPGFVVGAHACMARSAVFVLSSLWEGLPTVLIEALVVGTPVVATDCPSGPREILRGGELGRLVSPGDIQGLADGILAVLAGGGPRATPADLTQFTQEFAVERYLRLVQNGSR